MAKIKSLAPDGSYSCDEQSINGYSQTGQELKEQFLRDARALLKQTVEFLTRSGWTECDIRVNSAGMAVSGDVYAEFWKPADPLNTVYCTIGASAIPFGGRKDGVIIMARQHQREAWIAGKVYGIDALIVNPRLVETGLDLIAFSNVVFVEIEYSLYTLWQALRRVWRPGQTQKVKAVFAIYNNTLEARALALMGQKMKAGQTLYGDEVGGAIVPEDEGNLPLKLAREALNKADIPDLQSLFAENCRVERPAVSITEIEMAGAGAELAPADTPAAPTRTTTFDAWMDGRGTGILNSGRRKKAVEGQMSLFDLVK